MNIALSDHGRTQDKAISNLILVRSLLDAALTKSTESQKQLLLELDETRTENKRLQLLLQDAKSEMLMMEQLHDDELDEMTGRMVQTEQENIDLTSRVQKQFETINALTTGKKLLDAGYTATFKSYAQATQDLDDTRAQLYHTQNELEASKVHIILQDEDCTAQLQLLDELQNDLKARDKTILGLQSRLQAQDEVYVQQHQWSYPWPPHPYLQHSPRFFPSYPTPNPWSQEHYPIPLHSPAVQPYHHSNSSVIFDPTSGTPQVCSPSGSIIHDTSCSFQPVPDVIIDSHLERRKGNDQNGRLDSSGGLRDDQPPHLSPSNATVDSARSQDIHGQLPPVLHLSPLTVTADSVIEETTSMTDFTNNLVTPDSCNETKVQEVLHGSPNHLTENLPFESTHTVERMTNDPSTPTQLAPTTAASPEKHMQIKRVNITTFDSLPRKKPRRGCRAGKKHKKHKTHARRRSYERLEHGTNKRLNGAIKPHGGTQTAAKARRGAKGTIDKKTAAQGSRGSHGRGRTSMTNTAAQGSRGPRGRGRIPMTKDSHKLSTCDYNNTMSTGAGCKSKRGAIIITNDSEDHDIGHHFERGGRVKANEFTKRRLDLSLNCSLVRGASGCETANTAS